MIEIGPGLGMLLFDALALWPLTRIFGRTGINPKLALLVFVPVIGLVLVIFVLGLSRWSRIPPLPKPQRKIRRTVTQ